MSNKTIMTDYLDAFTSGDIETGAALLADDYQFEGPMVTTDNKADFLEQTGPAQAFADGYKMIQQVEQADTVVSVYEFGVGGPAKNHGSVPMVEVSTFNAGKIASSKLYFDTARLMSLLGEQG